MLNKLQFNNLIISNKKRIQHGRTQTIQKLIQKIRKLKSHLDKQSDNDKTKSRFRKATETLNYLKKLKPIDIIKNVLLLNRGPAAIITDGLSMPEETGNALLALNKTIQNLITTFKESLNLSDSSLKWREELAEVSKRRIKKNKTAFKKEMRKDVKEQKAITRKRLEWIKENNPGTVVEEDIDVDQKVITTVGQWKIGSVEEVSLTPPTKVTESEKDKKLKKKKARISANTTEPIDEERLVAPKSEKSKKFKKKNVDISENTYSAPENVSLSKTNIDNRIVVDLEPVVTHVIDPFFFTETGENYFSTAVISRGPNSSIANMENKKTISDTQIKIRDDNRSKPINGKNRVREQTNYVNGELHPSWAAKRRNSSVTEFQGKTKTIDGNEAYRVKESGKISKNAKNVTNKELEKLHPSWIAKQKMKSTITTFQGKKTLFASED